MFDHDEEPAEPDERPAYDWDAWERNRFTGLRKWWILMLAAITVMLTIQFLTSDGNLMPFTVGR